MHEHPTLLVGTGRGARAVGRVGLAGLGVGVAVRLVVLALAPLVTVVGYERVGHRHAAEALEQMTSG